jgi:hypothetical protein
VCFLQSLKELGRLERLLEKVQGARSHGLHGKRHIAMAGDHDHYRAHRPLLQVAHEIQPAHSRQA